jgi:cyd operon protein YbgT
MWYFTWILGLGAALAFGIINVMWLEASYSFGELDPEATKRRFGDRGQQPQAKPASDAATEAKSP